MLGYVRFLEYLEQPAPPGVVDKPKTGRKKDPDTQQRNRNIYTDFVRYVLSENRTSTQAYDRLLKTYGKCFTGKDQRGQIRRIVRDQKQTQTDTN